MRPSQRAQSLAAEVDKDPRLVEVILRESRRVVRHRPGVLIVEHRLGFIMANAGVDRSNVDPATGVGAGAAAAGRSRRLGGGACAIASPRTFGKRLGVIISDSFGRAWRRGTVGVALGVAGLPALIDMRGQPDLFGRALRVTQTGFADEIAAAASLLMGQADEARPAVLVRGLSWSAPASPAAGADPPGRRGLVPMSARDAGSVAWSRCRAASAAPSSRLGLSRVMAGAPTVVAAIPATISSIWASRSRPTSTR